jgi:hypothetical protein
VHLLVKGNFGLQYFCTWRPANPDTLAPELNYNLQNAGFKLHFFLFFEKKLKKPNKEKNSQQA